MNILVVGGGLIGLSSAFFLRKNGHNVKIIERQSDVALETSFANGGQLSASYSEPWSNWSNVSKIMSWMGKDNSPILLRPKLSMHQIKWGIDFLLQCSKKNNEKNIKKMMEISLYSRQVMKELRDEYDLNYEQKLNGIITFYRNQKNFEDGQKAANLMAKFGCERAIKNVEEVLQLEPSLKTNNVQFAGADYTEMDSSGNAKMFCDELKKIALASGVEFIFDTELTGFQFDDMDKISKVILKKNGREFKLNGFDCVVLAAGSYTYQLAQMAGISLNIYPAKGYSATFDILPGREAFVNNVSLTDSDNKIVYTRLGNKLRVAGTAEFNGYNLDLNEKRCAFLTKMASEMFPDSLDLTQPSYWCGLRPSTPGNVPIIAQSKVKNLYINSGHGTLGWTMAAGSGRMIQQIIDGQKLFS